MSSHDVTILQSDEVKALRSIFCKEFKLIRPKNLKKKYEPPLMSIMINVDSSNLNTNLSLRLSFDCPYNYPFDIPKITISDAVNVPTNLIEQLLKLLNEKSNQSKGYPMIYNLVEEARCIIIKHFEIEHKSVNSISTINKVLNEDEILQTEAKKSEYIKQLLRQRKDSARNEKKNEKKFEKCDHSYKTDVLEFKHCSDRSSSCLVYKGLCDGQHRIKTINPTLQIKLNTFNGFNCQKGINVKICQIRFSDLKRKQFEDLKSNWLSKLEEDFALLYELNHPNLITYYGFRYQAHEKIIRKNKHFDLVIQYVTSNDEGMKLSKVCEMETKPGSAENGLKARLSIGKIRHYLKSILEAVIYLHDKNITFIKINMDSILIDKDLQLKMCNFCIGKRFEELKDREHSNEHTPGPKIKKGSIQYDLIKLGALAKQLFFFGLPELEPEETDMPHDLSDFITSCESNIEELKLHPFLTCENPSNNSRHNSQTIDSAQDLKPWHFIEKSSRFPKEFELICKLGEGAFGDVVKVRNIYDNQYYAIKRVRLNAIKKKAARTMKEVQLLSSLNHENIVRYYASWSEEIEKGCSQTDTSQTNLDSSSIRNNTSSAISVIKPETTNSFLLNFQEKNNRNVNFSQIEHCSRHFDLESYSDSESDSDSELNNQSTRFKQPSVDISFGYSGNNANQLGNDDTMSVIIANGCKHNEVSDELSKQMKSIHMKSGYINDSQNINSHSNKIKIEKYLMIQMELCEGQYNTLQKYIDEQKLYMHEKVIWRFIREIVSGLEHIHSKNMVHRDLKPHNIFLDSQKRVKIGDLGLAMNLNTKVTDSSNQECLKDNNLSNDIEKGPVGTMMYICPEMLSHSNYTNKADMYSLGVIIFEMCHKPFSTGSERYHILGNLRRPEIIFPDEKHFKIMPYFVELIKSLLNHDQSLRPSASELLKSNIIPPPEGKELELRKFLTGVTKNSSSNLYKLMLKELFSQLYSEIGRYELPLLYQSPFNHFISNTKSLIFQNLRNPLSSQIGEGEFFFFTLKRLVTRHIESIFVSHGGVEFLAPLLSPKLKNTECGAFCLLDAEGVVVNLPNNLRMNFANFLVNNSISCCKRYAIGPIYQQQDIRRDHPRELIEAAFDIVTDYDSPNKTAEILYLLHQIFKKCFNFEHVTLTLEINQTDLFYALMNHYNILASLHDTVAKDIEHLDSDHFKSLTNLSEKQLANIKSILLFNGSRLEDLEKHFNIFQNRIHQSYDVINKAFKELKSVEEKLKHFTENLCFCVNFRPSLVPLESIYNGLVFQIILKVQDKFLDVIKPPSSDKSMRMTVRYLKNQKILSSGGDYSSYMMKVQQPFLGECGDVHRFVSAVGASIDVSTMLQSMYSIEQLIRNFGVDIGVDQSTEYLMNSAVNVVVQYDIEKHVIIWDLVSRLWAANISAEIYDKNEHGEEYVFNQKIHFYVRFPSRYDENCYTDARISVKRNDWKGLGLEQISNDDVKKPANVVDLILRELKKSKEYLFNRFEKESYQRQTSDNLSAVDPWMDVDNKKTNNPKTEAASSRYIYKFINAKESSKFGYQEFTIPYFVESNKHMQSLTQKIPNLEMPQIQLIRKVNCLLLNINKWNQGKFPNPLYCLICDLSHSKCLSLVEEVTLKSLKETNRLTKLFNEIESSRNYQNNVEKQWKDVLARIWESLQNAVKEKLFRIVIFSQIDENFVFLEIK